LQALVSVIDIGDISLPSMSELYEPDLGDAPTPFSSSNFLWMPRPVMRWDRMAPSSKTQTT
jgi:hypothetical protein